MSYCPDALWVNVSPNLRQFDRSLLGVLSQNMVVAEWQYRQSEDEPTSLIIAMDLLHNYLKKIDRPLHLIEHGTGGIVSINLYSLLSSKSAISYFTFCWSTSISGLASSLLCSISILAMYP